MTAPEIKTSIETAHDTSTLKALYRPLMGVVDDTERQSLFDRLVERSCFIGWVDGSED